MVLTVDEVRAHLRIQHADEDAYIGSLIEQAQSAVYLSSEKPTSQYK